MTTRTITVKASPEMLRHLAASRPTLRHHLGRRLHPESVTAAWYAADCPPVFDPRPVVSGLDYALWRVASRLRMS